MNDKYSNTLLDLLDFVLLIIIVFLSIEPITLGVKWLGSQSIMEIHSILYSFAILCLITVCIITFGLKVTFLPDIQFSKIGVYSFGLTIFFFSYLYSVGFYQAVGMVLIFKVVATFIRYKNKKYKREQYREAAMLRKEKKIYEMRMYQA